MAATEKQKANLIPPVIGEVRNPNGRPVGSKNTKTILERFLNLEMKQKNPFTQNEEQMTVLELMNLKQIANALEGDLQAFKEIIDRHEGKVATKIDQNSNVNINSFDITKLYDKEAHETLG